MTPPPKKMLGRTRAIEGHVLNENLWPNVQLHVIGYKVLRLLVSFPGGSFRKNLTPILIRIGIKFVHCIVVV